MKVIVDIPNELAEKGHWYTDEEMWTVIKSAQNGTPITDNATVCVEPTFDWLQNRVALAKAEINNAIESTFCTKDEAIGLGVALNVIDKYFTI